VLAELSAAFAHELAQPLTSILANAEVALQLTLHNATASAELKEILRDIIRDDMRAAEMIHGLRALLVRGKVQRRPVDLHQVVHDVLSLLRGHLMAHNVVVTQQLGPHSPFVMADAIQLQQVLTNLVMNSCQAMSGKPNAERQLSIATRMGEDDCNVECSVTDRGEGIPAHSMERVFEPFVTTKAGGLGLGLPLCRSIIEAHGGRLWAESTVGHGASFRFTVALADRCCPARER